jgi:ATP-binding cassette subfamily B (MDR/TAP) protein 7
LTQDGSVKLESVQKSKPANPAGQDPLLTERTVSDKEQRKADWAIIKEMSRYLWPKVRLADTACQAMVDLV